MAFACEPFSKPVNLQRELDTNVPLGLKLGLIHDTLMTCYPAVNRIAVALYDAKTDMLSTFLHSSGGGSPLLNYSAKLSEVWSLRDIARQGMPRVLNDLAVSFQSRRGIHSQRLFQHGYRSSLTYPFYHNGRLLGFVFYNSREAGVFGGTLLNLVNILSQVIASLIIKETTFAHTLTAAIRTAQNISRHKDEETGAHLERMGHYCRIIATALAGSHGFDDEFIEYMHLFSPMHDIGKIATPDRILHKPAPLSVAEFDVIKDHPLVGREIVAQMASEFGLDGFQHLPMLANIVEYHHEAMDGSGYPHGLSAGAIPIEARICAVADVFDALTSARPYKFAWDNQRAFRELRGMAGIKLDPACVEGLIDSADKVVQIQGIFCDGVGT